MDLYTTSFTLPRHAPSVTSTPGPSSLPSDGLNSSPEPSSSTLTPLASIVRRIDAEQVEKDWKSVQKLASDVTAREGCQVTVTREPSSAQPGGEDQWNFHLSGTQQSVMAARGAIIRGYPRNNSVKIKVPRNDILQSRLMGSSLLKAEVQGRLEIIAVETGTEISVMNGESGPAPGKILVRLGSGVREKGDSVSSRHTKTASGQSGSSGSSILRSVNGTSGQSTATTLSSDKEEKSGLALDEEGAEPIYGLELERMCEIRIDGDMENVQIAKVRILVLLDQLAGLHAEPCEIDHKLHPILAGRKRMAIQTIEEETATNIYLPIPLVGIHNSPHPNSQAGNGHAMSYRSIQSVGTITSQSTGMTQMTGYSQTGMENIWPGMGHDSIGNGYGLQNHHQHNPNYNSHHQHHHPRHHFEPHQVGYGGPSNHHNQHQQYRQLPHMNGGMSVQHTGMSNMTEYQHSRVMPNNRHMGMGNGYPQGYPHPQHYEQQQPGNIHHHHRYQHQQQPGFPSYPNHPSSNGHSSNLPNHMLGIGIDPYTNGGHGHNGLGGVQMGINGDMGMMGNNHHVMASNVGDPGQFGPNPHSGLSTHGGEQGSMGKANEIWITGEFFGVQRARDMLLNIAMQKSRMVISRDTAILPRKLDWLLTDRLEDIKKTMSDNETYLQLPSVGSQASLISVFGDHRVAIERSIRSIMALACEFYVASVWLLPVKFDVHLPQPILTPAQIQPIIKRISTSTSAEVVFKSNSFEVHGLETEVRAAVSMILDLEMIKNFQPEIRFHIELANEHRDFISGKKNGKINKIMKTAGVKIKFETYNDYNFLMDISGSNLNILQGLSLLQEELPTELSFHIPENYHKRIIGVGGKNIQRIMKLYGVYVKFSNAEEYASLGGYKENEDNVIARTPRKNVGNLESLQQSIMEFVATKNKDYLLENVTIPRRYHRTLLGEKSIFIHDIEGKTNSIVRFPSKESASDIVTIFGPESQVDIAIAMLLDHIPFEADLHVPSNPDLTAIVASPEFISFTEDIKRDHQIAISLAAIIEQADETVFKFRCQRSHIGALGLAQDALKEYLAEQGIQLFPSGSKRKDASFEKLFTRVKREKAVKIQVKAPTTLEPGEIIIPVQIRSRPISNDVKALFDEPGTFDDASGQNKGFAGPFHNPRRSSEIWQSPQPIRNEITSTPPLTELHLKRESDPLVHEKIRQATVGPGVPLAQVLGHGHGPSRGTAARTQSLDITSSLNFSRALSLNGGGGFESVLDGSIGSAGAIGDSPNTASGLYFPSTAAGISGGKGPSTVQASRDNA